jgi:ubiquinone biosynthesis protein COQ9
MDEATVESTRQAVLAAALAHVPFDGWSAKALAAGAREAGRDPAELARFFPRGPIDAIRLMSEVADRAMADTIATADPALGLSAKIALGVRARLESAAPHKEAVRRALAVLALPQHAPLALRLLYRTVDKSTDFNFYTKRAILAAIYSGTLMFWLNDRSEGAAATWAFLERRLADHLRLHKGMARLRERAAGLPHPFKLLDRLRQGPRPRRRGRL